MGSDTGVPLFVTLATNFNPRSRMGSDGLYGQFAAEGRISIHAPAWGATHCSSPFIGWC